MSTKIQERWQYLTQKKRKWRTDAELARVLIDEFGHVAAYNFFMGIWGEDQLNAIFELSELVGEDQAGDLFLATQE
jgi:hypothetical protein